MSQAVMTLPSRLRLDSIFPDLQYYLCRTFGGMGNAKGLRTICPLTLRQRLRAPDARHHLFLTLVALLLFAALPAMPLLRTYMLQPAP